MIERKLPTKGLGGMTPEEAAKSSDETAKELVAALNANVAAESDTDAGEE